MINNLIVQRKELKYYINYADYKILKDILKNYSEEDKEAIMNKGFIRSLYFDTLSDKDFNEKQSGVLNRKKYRLRIYNLDAKKIKFEIKNKINEQILKESVLIDRKDAIEIQNENYDVLLKYNNTILNKIYCEFKKEIYRPVILVDYTREAFNFPFNNTRITFDKNIKVCSENLDIFNKNQLMKPLLKKGVLVMEIKFNKFLPLGVKKLIQIPRFEMSAISKYCIGRLEQFA